MIADKWCCFWCCLNGFNHLFGFCDLGSYEQLRLNWIDSPSLCRVSGNSLMFDLSIWFTNCDGCGLSCI
ncbi:hypothetical protein HanRHA438_Chr02g0084121 [Helianthus annuus]|nr:hypothetical protein HanIR_Chr09g0430031 [Helianthus annuus]KAJ0615955.1 hypothetical protein HanIR_Chr02g0085121 [Helianthus annuus]KAJ0940501.1 hypothetical protein HanRHA438_Chr02g0084121 [Helianthus annuus]KAJ0952266.1 hypothetical protein HanPSC8_Chr02g0070191 [Helianthus annuus]